VRESLVLLKNEKDALPLSRKIKQVHVMGRAANDLGMQCGGWTISWQGETGTITPGGTTILGALRDYFGPRLEVSYSEDSGPAKYADAIVVVIGETPYAEMKGDRSDLSIPGKDAALVAKAKKGGSPVITILLSGRPLILGSVLDDSDALVAAWLPGTEGGGIMDVLFGDYPVSGRLPHAWPRNNRQAAVTGASIEPPLFPRDFGLTYRGSKGFQAKLSH
jgi:beta-glucosidase